MNFLYHADYFLNNINITEQSIENNKFVAIEDYPLHVGNSIDDVPFLRFIRHIYAAAYYFHHIPTQDNLSNNMLTCYSFVKHASNFSMDVVSSYADKLIWVWKIISTSCCLVTYNGDLKQRDEYANELEKLLGEMKDLSTHYQRIFTPLILFAEAELSLSMYRTKQSTTSNSLDEVVKKFNVALRCSENNCPIIYCIASYHIGEMLIEKFDGQIAFVYLLNAFKGFQQMGSEFWVKQIQRNFGALFDQTMDISIFTENDIIDKPQVEAPVIEENEESKVILREKNRKITEENESLRAEIDRLSKLDTFNSVLDHSNHMREYQLELENKQLQRELLDLRETLKTIPSELERKTAEASKISQLETSVENLSLQLSAIESPFPRNSYMNPKYKRIVRASSPFKPGSPKKSRKPSTPQKRPRTASSKFIRKKKRQLSTTSSFRHSREYLSKTENKEIDKAVKASLLSQSSEFRPPIVTTKPSKITPTHRFVSTKTSKKKRKQVSSSKQFVKKGMYPNVKAKALGKSKKKRSPSYAPLNESISSLPNIQNEQAGEKYKPMEFFSSATPPV